MEIRSTSGIPNPRQPSRNQGVRNASSQGTTPAKDSFTGPAYGDFLKKLSEIDGIRSEKIDLAREELKSGAYFTDERIERTLDQLLSNL